LIGLSLTNIEVTDKSKFVNTVSSVNFSSVLLNAIALYNSSISFVSIDGETPDEAFIDSFSNAYRCDDISFDNVVTDTCRKLEQTQKELAKTIGIGYTTLNRWSRGEVKTPIWAINFMSLLLQNKIDRQKDEHIKSAIKILQGI
jgi:DNA-binding XRE family transcriptional regulator